MNMKKYRVDFAWREGNGHYYEGFVFETALSLKHAFNLASSDLGDKRKNLGWQCFEIYNIGLMGDPDEEVC